jgi:hypothetical protein
MSTSGDLNAVGYNLIRLLTVFHIIYIFTHSVDKILSWILPLKYLYLQFFGLNYSLNWLNFQQSIMYHHRRNSGYAQYAYWD